MAASFTDDSSRDTILERQIMKRGAVLFRTNEHIIKLLMYQDMFPVRFDLYWMVDILQFMTRLPDLPTIVRNLVVGLQDRLLDCADGRHYEEVIRIFIKHKPMYHTCLNIYFKEDCVWWMYYLWACRQWRSNVVAACTDLTYHPVDYKRIRPRGEEKFKHKPEHSIRLKAMMTYLKYFGTEGKKYLRIENKTSFVDSFDIAGRLKSRKAKDKKEKEKLRNPGRPLSTMTKRELHNKKDGIETRYNMHIIMIPDGEDLITELEYIERLERTAQGLNSCFLYAAEEDPADIVRRATVEHFGRAFAEYRKHNCERNVPFDPETGELLEPEDDVDVDIRSGRKKEKPLIEDLDLRVELAKRGGAKDEAASRVNQLFTGPKATVAVQMTADELLDMFVSDKEKAKRPVDPREPKIEVRIMYDSDGISRMETTRVPPRKTEKRNSPKKDDHDDLEFLFAKPSKKTAGSDASPPRGKNNVPRPPLEHLPEDLSNLSSVLEIKDKDGSYIVASMGGKEEGGDPLKGIMNVLRKDQSSVHSLPFPDAERIKQTKNTASKLTEHNEMVNSQKAQAKKGTQPASTTEEKDANKADVVTTKEELSIYFPGEESKAVRYREVKLKENRTGVGLAVKKVFVPITPKISTRCYVCSSVGQHKKCGRCLTVDYCSRECQKFNWPEHKAMCRLILEEKSVAAREQAAEAKAAECRTTESTATEPMDTASTDTNMVTQSTATDPISERTIGTQTEPMSFER